MRKTILWLALVALLPLACSKPSYEFNAGIEPPAFPQGLKSTADSRLRMATRSYVASALKEIFGVTATESIDRFVTNQVIAFGGEPCDPNADSCKEAGGASQLPPVPFASPMRMAVANRACQEIVSIDTALSNAVRIVRLQSLQTSATPSPLDIPAAFELFYTGRAPSPDVVQDLGDVVSAAAKIGMAPLEQWRVLLGTLCESPGWQIP